MPTEKDGLDAIVEKILNSPICDNARDIVEKQETYMRLVEEHAIARDEHHSNGGVSWDWAGHWSSQLNKAEEEYRKAVALNAVETIRCILKDPDMVAAIKNLP